MDLFRNRVKEKEESLPDLPRQYFQAKVLSTLESEWYRDCTSATRRVQNNKDGARNTHPEYTSSTNDADSPSAARTAPII